MWASQHFLGGGGGHGIGNAREPEIRWKWKKSPIKKNEFVLMNKSSAPIEKIRDNEEIFAASLLKLDKKPWTVGKVWKILEKLKKKQDKVWGSFARASSKKIFNGVRATRVSRSGTN